jgi:uncharacterized paraquat-inducible protein A
LQEAVPEMPQPPQEETKSQTLHCPACKEDFITYKLPGQSACPRCGQQVAVREHRHVTGLVVVAVLFAIAVAVVAYLVLR